jgi:hypothetical protein
LRRAFSVTGISAYLHMEVPDFTEPASFYAPGASSWDHLSYLRRSLLFRPGSLVADDSYDGDEPEELEQ